MTLAHLGKSGKTTILGTALAAFALLGGCVQPPGYIVDALPDSSFVENSERRYLFSQAQGGWLTIGLNGQIHRRLFGPEYSIKDVSADGRQFALTNSHTDLFIARDGGRSIREVPEFHGLLGSVGFSPDGRVIAATRHPDFDQPQDQWVENDQLYLIDTTSLAVSEVGRFDVIDDQPPSDAVWLDDHHVLLRSYGRDQQIDARTGNHEIVPDGEDWLLQSGRWRTAHGEPADCGMEIRVLDLAGGSGGIEVVRPGGPPRHVIAVADARPPHPHESGDNISAASFTRDCRYITFEFQGGLWVAEVASGQAGPILPERNQTFERWYPIGLR